MRFIIYGAGAIGGVIGAQLFQAGHQVMLIARGDHLAEIRRNGLNYQTPHKAANLMIPAEGHPREIVFQPDDVVIMCMKSQHTLAALHDLRSAAGDRVPVICCQNGVANERMALRLFANTYAMLVYLPAESLASGQVRTHALSTIGILDAGGYPNGTDDRIAEVTAALESANFSARPHPTVMRFKYGKLLMNLGNSLQAACPPGAAADPIRRLLRAEGEAAFTAAGIDAVSRAEEKARRGDLLQFGEVAGAPRGGGSSWQSIMRGAGNIEADYLNGEIVLLGRLHGVPTPANAVLQRTANDLACRGGAAQSIAAADILAEIRAES